MVSEKTIATIKATAPLLQTGGEALTQHFYKRMFSHNPEVLTLFNPAHQATGHQQRALAGAICAYAANIDNLEALGSAVELIAQKHVSLRIKPEHYPIVGENLLASIKEVLGDVATPEVIDAWGQAYDFLADILIKREATIYSEQVNAEGGWEDFKKFKVVKKEKESDVITSFYFKPEDGGSIPSFKPGQYITIRVPTANGSTTMRNYSLSNKPGSDYFRISVKREDGSVEGTPSGYVSNMLHNSIGVGDVVELAPPCGEFFIDPAEKSGRPLVLLAGGVGITPLLSMLLAVTEVNPDRKIYFIHANLHEERHAFGKTVDELAKATPNLKVHYCYSDPVPEGVERILSEDISTGFVDGELLESVVGGFDADYYFCGPTPFMTHIVRELHNRRVPESQIHFEFFGPREELEAMK